MAPPQSSPMSRPLLPGAAGCGGGRPGRALVGRRLASFAAGRGPTEWRRMGRVDHDGHPGRDRLAGLALGRGARGTRPAQQPGGDHQLRRPAAAGRPGTGRPARTLDRGHRQPSRPRGRDGRSALSRRRPPDRQRRTGPASDCGRPGLSRRAAVPGPPRRRAAAGLDPDTRPDPRAADAGGDPCGALSGARRACHRRNRADPRSGADPGESQAARPEDPPRRAPRRGMRRWMLAPPPGRRKWVCQPGARGGPPAPAVEDAGRPGARVRALGPLRGGSWAGCR